MSPPRTLIFSQRHVDRMVYQCWKYEFEDIVREVDSVDMIAPSPLGESRVSELTRRALNRVRPRVGLLPRVGTEEVEVSRHYELFFAAFLFPAEALYLNKLRGWRERATHAACFLGDVWTKDADVLRTYAPLLRQFDHIFLHVAASLPLVASIVGRPCHLLHVAVDTPRFCPLPNPPARVVDCYSFGRRVPAIHEALLRLTRQKRFFYVYDTVKNFAVNDSFEHRGLVAETAKRSRYVIAFKHNLNAANQTGGDEALGSRLFEGMAAGAVLLGMAPDCPEFEANFDWPDAVIELPVDVTDIAEYLSDLDGQAARLRLARKNNLSGMLHRHDWVHRWSTILEIVGMKPLSGVDVRRSKLAELARLVETAD